jgi:hypothetical protein
VASAIRRMQPEWYERLRTAYANAKAKGDYGSTYAMTDEQEYWAEGSQCWFDCANAGNSGGASNRAQLKAKDQALADLLTEVYGDGEWRYVKTMNRPASDTADVTHLVGMNRDKLPVFNFNNSPRIKAEAEQKSADAKKAADEKKASDEKKATDEKKAADDKTSKNNATDSGKKDDSSGTSASPPSK